MNCTVAAVHQSPSATSDARFRGPNRHAVFCDASPVTITGRNGKFTCLYEKNKDHLKYQKIFNFTIKDSYIT